MPIVELRQYTLRPGRRDELIDLFDAELVESQEAVGMSVIGQFRDLDRPDRFVWLRGFPSVDERRASLEAFYGGPVWKAHREAANATMVATDDVLLLRPAEPSYAFRLEGSRRGADAGGDGPGFVAVTVVDLDGAEPSQAVELFEQALPTSLVESGGSLLGCYVTEPSPNTFPALTVREGENVLAWFAGHDELPTREVGSRQIPGKQPQQFLRLAPTSRSLLHGSAPGARRGEAHTSLRKGDR